MKVSSRSTEVKGTYVLSVSRVGFKSFEWGVNTRRVLLRVQIAPTWSPGTARY
jgi:hypothetical protein